MTAYLRIGAAWRSSSQPDRRVYLVGLTELESQARADFEARQDPDVLDLVRDLRMLRARIRLAVDSPPDDWGPG